jgi:protocatechuate 3,4-dioxygenase alpha subunit
VPRAPYLRVHVFARGLLRHLTTRIRFDEAALPENVPAARRDTLLAERTDDGYRFDIRPQGSGETVFFDV